VQKFSQIATQLSNPSSIEANTKLVTEEVEKSTKVTPNTGSQEISNLLYLKDKTRYPWNISP